MTIVDPKGGRCVQIKMSLLEKGWFGDVDPDLEFGNGVDPTRASVIATGGLSQSIRLEIKPR